MSILDKLNEEQREAAEKTHGPVLIIAGAGSGKTRTLTVRLAYLIKEKQVPPNNILAVTFTNKAAQEMLLRIKELLGLSRNISNYSQNLPHVGTFHSICAKILRSEIEKIGYKKSFVIYDDQDQLALIKRVMKELQIAPDQIKPQAILGTISNAKNKLIDEEDFEKQAGSYFEEIVAKCYSRYTKELKNADALDFDDIIMLTVKIFRQYPAVLEYYQDLFRYIMVDEYQDTNHAQYVLISLLAKKYRNLCVVGDDFQSIYRWRGADVQNILDFEKDYPEAKVVMLEQNYRSTQNILDAAYCVISKNVNRKDKKLWTEKKEGQLLTSFEAQDEREEAQFVSDEIRKLSKEMKLNFADFAVLYRTNAQSRALEEAFLRAGMPYKIIGGVKFYQRKEIKDVLAYLRFIQNPADVISFSRIINLPVRGIGEKTASKVVHLASEKTLSVIEAIKLLQNVLVGEKMPPAKRKVLMDFAFLIEKFQGLSSKIKLTELIEKVYQETGYEKMLLQEGEEGLLRHENVQELLTVAKKYDDEPTGLESFLQEVALVSQTDEDLLANEAVPFMTMHSAKGLEFEVVFIVGMEEGLLPHSRSHLNELEMEEERRLCYVGITRAKQKVYLLFTRIRNIYGSTQVSIKSRFVDEIDSTLFEETCFEDESLKDEYSDFLDIDENDQQSFFVYSKKKKKAIELKTKSKNHTSNFFKDGDKVSHSDFGEGIVIMQDDEVWTVAFPKFGLKRLAKGVSPLKRV